MEELLELLNKPVSLINEDERKRLETNLDKLSNQFRTVDDINLFIEQCITLFNRILEKNPNDLECIKKRYNKSTLIDEKLLKNFSHQIWKKGKDISNENIIAIIRFIENINTRKLNENEQIAFRKLCEILFETIYYPFLDLQPDRIEYADERRLKITKLCQRIILSDIPKNITKNEQESLFDIIYRHTSTYIMGDEYELFIRAHSLLIELGMDEEKRQELIEEKLRQLIEIDKNEEKAKKRT